MSPNPQNEELAMRLMKQGLARTHLDAMRMAESMNKIQTHPDNDTMRSAEKFWQKGQANPMDLNLKPQPQRDRAFVPSSQPPTYTPQRVQSGHGQMLTVDVDMIKSHLESQATAIAQLQAQVKDLQERMNRILPPQ
jgi:hypothetical protein